LRLRLACAAATETTPAAAAYALTWLGAEADATTALGACAGVNAFAAVCAGTPGCALALMKATEDAIAEASLYPLSIVVVGVGDGPWELMEKYDDSLRNRKYDNFQFVDFNTVFRQYPGDARHLALACHCLMEVPAQYNAAKMLGYFNPKRVPPKFVEPPMPYGPPDNPNPGDPSHGLIPGWTPVYDSEHKTFFYMDKKTNQRVWGRPVDAHALINGTLHDPPPMMAIEG